MDPSGSYTSTPASFIVTESLTIQSQINKEYDCSDHFFVITSSSTFGTWSWTSESDRIKVVWNCDQLMVYYPGGELSGASATVGLHYLTIVYTSSSVSATTDVDGVDLSTDGSFWSEVWLWMGADDDAFSGSEFFNTMVTTCDSCILNSLESVV